MNKKIIVIVVIAECILAILLVSVMGAAIENSRKNVLATEIYFLDDTGKKCAKDHIVMVDLSGGNIGYQLHYRVGPENATDTTVAFTCDQPDNVIVSPTGYVTFIEEVQVTVTVSTTDGSSRSASITLIPKPRKGTVSDF